MENPTGIATSKSTGNDIVLYPNPNTGSFNLTGKIAVSGPVVTEVVSIVGRIVYREAFNVNNGLLNQQISLPDAIVNGIYFLRIHSADGTDIVRFRISR
jgi:hypothetical protein